MVFIKGGEVIDCAEILGEDAVGVFRVPVVESKNDVAVLLCFGEIDVGLVGD